MICHGSYYGDKADVWSTGCILLELVLGHERFCDAWMAAYDYDFLQDRSKFTAEIKSAVERLPEALNFSEDLNDFILRFLRLRSTDRPHTHSLCLHKWLDGAIESELRPPSSADFLMSHSSGGSGLGSSSGLSIPIPGGAGGLGSSPSVSPSKFSGRREFDGRNAGGAGGSSGVGADFLVDPTVLREASSSVSDKERRMYEDHNQLHHHHHHHHHHPGSGLTIFIEEEMSSPAPMDVFHPSTIQHHQLHLPPIEPATPSVRQARKLLGDEGPTSRPLSPIKPAALHHISLGRHHDGSDNLLSHSPVPSISLFLEDFSGKTDGENTPSSSTLSARSCNGKSSSRQNSNPSLLSSASEPVLKKLI